MPLLHMFYASLPWYYLIDFSCLTRAWYPAIYIFLLLIDVINTSNNAAYGVVIGEQSVCGYELHMRGFHSDSQDGVYERPLPPACQESLATITPAIADPRKDEMEGVYEVLMWHE